MTGTGDGTWNLIVKDDAFDDTGSLTEWTLTYNTISGVNLRMDFNTIRVYCFGS
ncbi:MAG: proprotein convertase P-domain-containing protein [Bacteroidetes bacterium]|nr:proprotein convertase P-domain-containing protein [Bacteroidota bacterium]